MIQAAMQETESIKTIGKYRVLGIIGQGAMGVVYKAQDPEIGRLVAIKTLRNIPVDDEEKLQEYLKRFMLEARSAGNLRHANIVTIYEVNKDGNFPYLVMDYLEGENLANMIEKNAPIEPRMVMHYLFQMADALDYAHSKGVIHRDIKPSNIMVDSYNTAHILDFGVATIRGSTLTDPKLILGSPGYMAPEQVLNQKVTSKADLFALAVVAFECLTGRRPFPGESFTTVINGIVNAKPRSLTEIAPRLPLMLEVEFERAFSKNPGERFTTATDMVMAFKRALGFQQTEPPPVSRSRESEKSSGFDSSHGARPDSAGAIFNSNLPVGDSPRSDDEGYAKARGANAANWEAKNSEDSGGQRLFDKSSSLQVYFGDVIREDKESTAFRQPIIIAGSLCVVAAILMFVKFVFFPDTPAVPSPPTAAQVAEIGVRSPFELPEENNLPAPRVEAVPSDKSVAEMNDRELLGVLVSGGVPDEMVLSALREAKLRNVPELLEASVFPLQSDSYVVRIETLKTVAQIGDKRIVPYILVRLDDLDPLVRGHAARALGALGDRRSIGYLTTRLGKEDVPEVQSAIKKAIEKLQGYPTVTN